MIATDDSRTILFDSGRFPLWFRIPALLFGLGVLWLGFALAAYRLFGVSLGGSFRDVRGSPLLGSLACFVIAAMWTFVWFARLRILFDAQRQELVRWTQGYLRSHERRVSIAGCRQLHISRVRGGFCGTSGWRLTVEFAEGRSELVADIPDIKSGVESLAGPLAAATKLPVIKHESVA
jgi:hypothetical protein